MYIFLTKNLQLIEKVEDDVRRKLFKQHLQWINIKILFSDINQIRTKKLNMFEVKGAHHRWHKTWLLSLQQEQMSYMRVTNMQPIYQWMFQFYVCSQPICKWERAVSSCLVNSKMVVGQSILAKSYATYFRDIHPIHVATAQKYSRPVYP